MARTIARNPAMQHVRTFPVKVSAFSTQAQSKLPLAVSSFPSRLPRAALVHLRQKLFREALCLRARQRLAIANPVPRAAALAQENRERRCKQRQALFQARIASVLHPVLTDCGGFRSSRDRKISPLIFSPSKRCVCEEAEN